MTIDLVRQRLDALFSEPTPRIALISGPWGCGKTHEWHEAQKRNHHFTRPILYVSLFGVRDVRSIERTLARSLAQHAATKAIASSSTAWRARLSKGIHFLSSKLIRRSSTAQVTNDTVAHYVEHHQILRLAQELAVDLTLSRLRDAVVVFDDLERRVHDSLPMEELLGWLHNLKETRHCRILIIANTRGLNDVDEESLKLLREKVLDEALSFELSPAQALDIALTTTNTALSNAPQAQALLRDNLENLAVTNLRVLLRIVRMGGELLSLMPQAHPTVLQAAMRSLALMGAAHWIPQDYPSLEWIMALPPSFSHIVFGHQPEEDDPQTLREANWRRQVNEYGYLYSDELAREIGRSVERGYFDPAAIQRLTISSSSLADRNSRSEKLKGAWNAFNNSLSGDSRELFETIVEHTRKSLDLIDPASLATTIALMREVGRHIEAQELLEDFLRQRPGPDADAYASIRACTDLNAENIREQLMAHFDPGRQNIDPRAGLLALGKGEPPTPAMLAAVEALTATMVRHYMQTVPAEEFPTLMRGLARLETLENQQERNAASSMRTYIEELCASDDPLMRRRAAGWRGKRGVE